MTPWSQTSVQLPSRAPAKAKDNLCSAELSFPSWSLLQLPCFLFLLKPSHPSFQRHLRPQRQLWGSLFPQVPATTRMTAMTTTLLGAVMRVCCVHTQYWGPYTHDLITTPWGGDDYPCVYLREGEEVTEGHTARQWGCRYQTQLGLKIPGSLLCSSASLLLPYMPNPPWSTITSSQSAVMLPSTCSSFWPFCVSNHHESSSQSSLFKELL